MGEFNSCIHDIPHVCDDVRVTVQRVSEHVCLLIIGPDVTRVNLYVPLGAIGKRAEDEVGVGAVIVVQVIWIHGFSLAGWTDIGKGIRPSYRNDWITRPRGPLRGRPTSLGSRTRDSSQHRRQAIPSRARRRFQDRRRSRSSEDQSHRPRDRSQPY